MIGEGEAKPRAATTIGVRLEVARRRYPELAGDGGTARLVVLAGEVGGRFSAETAQRDVQGGAQAAWMRWWSSILACAAARAFAFSLLDRWSVWSHAVRA